MDVLYQAYVLMDDKETFRFEIRENPIKKISNDGTINTEYPCFYGIMKATCYINGSSEIKTEVEYSAGSSHVYFSTDYENCMNFLVKKREEAFKKYRDMVNQTDTFHEKLLNSEIQKHIKNGVKKHSLWMEGYSATGESSTAQYLGEFEGDNFNEACDNWARTIEDAECYVPGTDKYRPSCWACEIFDNEIDARKSFG